MMKKISSLRQEHFVNVGEAYNISDSSSSEATLQGYTPSVPLSSQSAPRQDWNQEYSQSHRLKELSNSDRRNTTQTSESPNNITSSRNLLSQISDAESSVASSDAASCKPFNDLNLNTVDEEDEFLYGDSNSLPEIPKSVKDDPVENKKVIVCTGWSDDEDNADNSTKDKSTAAHSVLDARNQGEITKPNVSLLHDKLSRIKRHKKALLKTAKELFLPPVVKEEPFVAPPIKSKEPNQKISPGVSLEITEKKSKCHSAAKMLKKLEKTRLVESKSSPSEKIKKKPKCHSAPKILKKLEKTILVETKSSPSETISDTAKSRRKVLKTNCWITSKKGKILVGNKPGIKTNKLPVKIIYQKRLPKAFAQKDIENTKSNTKGSSSKQTGKSSSSKKINDTTKSHRKVSKTDTRLASKILISNKLDFKTDKLSVNKKKRLPKAFAQKDDESIENIKGSSGINIHPGKESEQESKYLRCEPTRKVSLPRHHAPHEINRDDFRWFAPHIRSPNVQGLPSSHMRPPDVQELPSPYMRPSNVQGLPSPHIRPPYVQGLPSPYIRPPNVQRLPSSHIRPPDVQRLPSPHLSRPSNLEHERKALETRHHSLDKQGQYSHSPEKQRGSHDKNPGSHRSKSPQSHWSQERSRSPRRHRSHDRSSSPRLHRSHERPKSPQSHQPQERPTSPRRHRSHERSKSPQSHWSQERLKRQRSHDRSRSPRLHRSHERSKSPQSHQSQERSRTPRRYRCHDRSRSPRLHKSRERSKSPQSHQSQERSRSPRRHKSHDRSSSPRLHRSHERSKSPQSHQSQERSRTPRRYRCHDRSRSPRLHRSHERSKSPQSHRPQERARSPRRHRSHDRSRSPRLHRSRERSKSPQSHQSRERTRSPRRHRSHDRSRSPRLHRSHERSKSPRRYKSQERNAVAKDKSYDKKKKFRDGSRSSSHSSFCSISFDSVSSSSNSPKSPEKNTVVKDKSYDKKTQNLPASEKKLDKKKKLRYDSRRSSSSSFCSLSLDSVSSSSSDTSFESFDRRESANVPKNDMINKITEGSTKSLDVVNVENTATATPPADLAKKISDILSSSRDTPSNSSTPDHEKLQMLVGLIENANKNQHLNEIFQEFTQNHASGSAVHDYAAFPVAVPGDAPDPQIPVMPSSEPQASAPYPQPSQVDYPHLPRSQSLDFADDNLRPVKTNAPTIRNPTLRQAEVSNHFSSQHGDSNDKLETRKSASAASTKNLPPKIPKESFEKKVSEMKGEQPMKSAYPECDSAADTNYKKNKNYYVEKYKKLEADMQLKQQRTRTTENDVTEMLKIMNNTFGKKISTSEKLIYYKCKNLYSLSRYVFSSVSKEAKQAEENLKNFKCVIPPEFEKDVLGIKVELTEEEAGEGVYTCVDSKDHICFLCSEKFSSISDMMDHIQSVEHKKQAVVSDTNWKAPIVKDKNKMDVTSKKNCDKPQLVQGIEFMKFGFFCDLCKEMVLDKTGAEEHLKSHAHFVNFKSFLKENPLYERKCLLKRYVQITESANIKRAKEMEEMKRFLEEDIKREEDAIEKAKAIVKDERSKEMKAKELEESEVIPMRDSQSSAHNKQEQKPVNESDTCKKDLSRYSPSDVFNEKLSKPNLSQCESNTSKKDLSKYSPSDIFNEKSPNLKSGQCGSPSASLSTNFSAFQGTPLPKVKSSKACDQPSKVDEKSVPMEIDNSQDSSVETSVPPSKEEKDFMILGFHKDNFKPLLIPIPPPNQVLSFSNSVGGTQTSSYSNPVEGIQTSSYSNSLGDTQTSLYSNPVGDTQTSSYSNSVGDTQTWLPHPDFPVSPPSVATYENNRPPMNISYPVNQSNTQSVGFYSYPQNNNTPSSMHSNTCNMQTVPSFTNVPPPSFRDHPTSTYPNPSNMPYAQQQQQYTPTNMPPIPQQQQYPATNMPQQQQQYPPLNMPPPQQQQYPPTNVPSVPQQQYPPTNMSPMQAFSNTDRFSVPPPVPSSSPHAYAPPASNHPPYPTQSNVPASLPAAPQTFVPTSTVCNPSFRQESTVTNESAPNPIIQTDPLIRIIPVSCFQGKPLPSNKSQGVSMSNLIEIVPTEIQVPSNKNEKGVESNTKSVKKKNTSENVPVSSTSKLRNIKTSLESGKNVKKDSSQNHTKMTSNLEHSGSRGKKDNVVEKVSEKLSPKSENIVLLVGKNRTTTKWDVRKKYLDVRKKYCKIQACFRSKRCS